MARPRKTGLDYFPLDVDFFADDKVVCIGGEYGTKGELTIIRLLCAVYRNGYYVLWNDNLKYKLKREMDGVSADLLEQIVRGLVRRGFFNEALFNSDSVLTSEGIQRRYFEATKFRERDQDLPYLLVFPRKNYTKTDISQWETPVSQPESTQIKRNEIKKSSDEDKKPSLSPSPFVEENFLKEFFGEAVGEKPDSAQAKFLTRRQAVVENLRQSLGILDTGAMKRMAAQILQDWSLRGHTPKDWEDAAAHLVSTLRIKAEASRAPSKPTCAPASTPSAKLNANLAEIDRQEEQRRQADREQKEKSESTDSLIRRMGYDPTKVNISQVFNPNWRRQNPPTLNTNGNT